MDWSSLTVSGPLDIPSVQSGPCGSGRGFGLDYVAMETWQAINSIRVVRKFTSEPLAPEHLERILNAGRRAASSKNEQTWAFIVITDRALLRELAAVGRYADHLPGAAAAVALVGPEESGPHVRTTMWDLGRAAQNMVLAAWELGIGSVPATAHNHKVASRLFGLPEDRRCDFLLSFGYPADPSRLTAPNKSGGRKSLDEVVRHNRW
jgi:nitroreductase